MSAICWSVHRYCSIHGTAAYLPYIDHQAPPYQNTLILSHVFVICSRRKVTRFDNAAALKEGGAFKSQARESEREEAADRKRSRNTAGLSTGGSAGSETRTKRSLVRHT